jgi:hypothetical protein
METSRNMTVIIGLHREQAGHERLSEMEEQLGSAVLFDLSRHCPRVNPFVFDFWLTRNSPEEPSES